MQYKSRNITRTLFAPSIPRFTINLTLYSSMLNTMQALIKVSFRSPHATLAHVPLLETVVLYVAALNNMRISEILSITPRQFLGFDRFLVFSAKKSASYTIVLHVNERSPGSFDAGLNESSFIPLSYNRLWSICRRVGLGFTPEGRRSVARTHAHRYNTAQAVAKISTAGLAGDVLHHKSGRSVSYYLTGR